MAWLLPAWLPARAGLEPAQCWRVCTVARPLRPPAAAATPRPEGAGPPPAPQLLIKALPLPPRFNDLMLVAEGRTAASTEPGDWRYRDFNYE